jgi:hypothetical protein
VAIKLEKTPSTIPTRNNTKKNWKKFCM